MAFPIVRAEDPAEVRVVAKLNAHQVERLALVPFRRRPHLRDGRNQRMVAISYHANGKLARCSDQLAQLSSRHVHQVVNARKPRVRAEIQRRDRTEQVETQSRVVAKKTGHLDPPIRCDLYARMPATDDHLFDRLAELRLEQVA